MQTGTLEPACADVLILCLSAPDREQPMSTAGLLENRITQGHQGFISSLSIIGAIISKVGSNAEEG